MDPCDLPTCLKIGIDPIAVHMGSFALYWYGILVAIGFVVAIRVATNEAAGVGLNPDQLLSATLVSAVFGLLLARVFFVIQNQPQYYIDGKHLGEALSLWQGGLSFYGGIFGALLGAWLYTARYNLPLLRFLDLGALVAPLGQALGRLGNVVNGDLTGLPTHRLGAEYTNSTNPLVPISQIGHAQAPVALLDAVFLALLFVALLVLWRRQRLRPGQLAGLYLVGIGAGQLFLVALTAAPVVFIGLKTGQLTALPIVAAGIWLYMRSGQWEPVAQATPNREQVQP